MLEHKWIKLWNYIIIINKIPVSYFQVFVLLLKNIFIIWVQYLQFKAIHSSKKLTPLTDFHSGLNAPRVRNYITCLLVAHVSTNLVSDQKVWRGTDILRALGDFSIFCAFNLFYFDDFAKWNITLSPKHSSWFKHSELANRLVWTWFEFIKVYFSTFNSFYVSFLSASVLFWKEIQDYYYKQGSESTFIIFLTIVDKIIQKRFKIDRKYQIPRKSEHLCFVN